MWQAGRGVITNNYEVISERTLSMENTYDFIVLGSGLAGLTSALMLREFGEVALISKAEIDECATNLAQGGIAAVVLKEDSFESHIKDTLVAGAYHNDKRAVEFLVRHAPHAIEWLEKIGVKFEKKNGTFSPTREAAHSYNRVLHVSDFSGREIEKVLVKNVRINKNIKILENCFALDLIVKKGRCFGVSIIQSGKINHLFGRATVLATGGIGQLYKWTTNPSVATGDGLAMVYRAGAALSDLEFIQFHPTALRHGNSPLFLLSEALRGEGAYVVNEKGERFLKKVDIRGELAPRDIVARTVFKYAKNHNVYLDFRHKGKDFLRKRFPNIYNELKKRGFDLASELVPVTPAAHYHCGGVSVDLEGKTNIVNLFAFGEVSSTGVHGANRLASNSLLETVVFARQLKNCLTNIPEKTEKIDFFKPNFLSNNVNIDKYIVQLKEIMWENVGIERQERALLEALEKLNSIWQKLEKQTSVNIELAQYRNMITVSRLITLSALTRKESLGAHFRSQY